MAKAEMHTLNGILAAAQSEFLEKGYQGAGLREIAKKTGVTTGALYGYFKNKSELFDALVQEHYDHIKDLYRRMLTEFAALPPEEKYRQMEEYTAAGMKQMVSYIYDHHDAFRLLLCCSEGTRYSNLVHEMALMDVEATHDFAKSTVEAGLPVREVNPMLEHILTSGMFTAFFELIVHDIPREQADEYMMQLLEFYQAGWTKLMNL